MSKSEVNLPEGAKKRLLVLTSATGAGHDTHARATADWCRKIYGDAVELRIDHTLEDSHFLYRGGVELYNLIQRRGPWLHHVYYNIIEMLEVLNDGTVSLGKSYYLRLLKEFRPDAILSVHDCLNLGYFELARQVLGDHVRCATYCPEFRGGYGFSRNWVNARGNAFFGRTEETVQAARSRGVKAQNLHVAGHWAPPEFYSPAPTRSEKAAILEQMELDPNRFTVLISTGGAGAQNHFSFLQPLLPLGDRLQAIVLCGRNVSALRMIERWVKAHASFIVRPLSFTEEMPKLLHVASTVVARAGATTAGEALLCGCPIIFNALGGIMPQEIPTWRYFKDRHVGHLIFRPGQLTAVLRNWLDNPADYLALQTRMRQLRSEVTPQAALKSLLED